MRGWIALMILLSLQSAPWDAARAVTIDSGFEADVNDKASLQRGARVFVNYCLSCHSATYMRFSRLAADLAIPEELVRKDLMFATDKIGDTMDVAMKAGDAEAWFGVRPPDLSVIARARGADWLYRFLTTFYLDTSRPNGVNNLVFKDTAMPHVLWELQGWQKAMLGPATDGSGRQDIIGLELEKPGTLDEKGYSGLVADLVNFLVYLGEPGRAARQRVGFGVLLFLAVFLVVAVYLKKEYWKDVH